MNSKANMPSSGSRGDAPGAVANKLVRQALKASLATLDRTSGHPYVSLVTLATEPQGHPIMLISRLALHTQNLAANPIASLLCDGTGADGDPLAGGRVTLMGKVEQTQSPIARARFLARHPSASVYADFADFSFVKFNVTSAHFVGGFGRIVDLTPADLGLEDETLPALSEWEGEILEHMNSDHQEAVALYAARLGGDRETNWRMTGIDPSGLDITGGGVGLRLEFDEKVMTPGAVRQELARLAAEARKAH